MRFMVCLNTVINSRFLLYMTNNICKPNHYWQKNAGIWAPFLSEERIVSSGCGFAEISQLRRMVDGEHVFVYGYDSSVQYVVEAGGVLVDDPMSAEVIVMSASVGSQKIACIATCSWR